MKEPSSNEEYEVYSRASYEVDIVPSTNHLTNNYFEWAVTKGENNKIRECTLGLKESIIYIEEIIKTFKIETTKIINSKEICEKCVSLKKEVIDLCETICKFTQGKEKLNLILSV